MITRENISIAYELIVSNVRQTPVLEIGADGLLPHPVSLKLEQTQHSGSFKARGAFNNLLSRKVPDAGIVAASGGNHGAAVAYAARALGHKARIYVPEISSPVKVTRIKSYKADVIVGGANYAEAHEASQSWIAETGAIELHPYDAPETLAGQGTMARELAGQIEEFDTILIAVGGGGLIGGSAAWIRDTARIVAVEPQNAPTLHNALKAGQPVDVEVSGIAADSLGASRVGVLGFELASAFVNDCFLVSDEAIRQAQKYLWQSAQIITEPGGATALAALISGAYVPEPGERLVVVVCGGNADLSAFS